MESVDVASPALDRHIAGCLYCGRPGPYSDEHVVSAGLGGDDSAWMLRGCVCSRCNTSTFSKLEAHVLKASPIGLARLFMQPTTRDGQPPSPLQAYTTLQLSDDGPQLAGQLAASGQPELYAQVVFEKDESGTVSEHAIGPDRPAIANLFGTLRDRLGDELVLIEKHAASSFTVTPLNWQVDRYRADVPSDLRKPPNRGIWFEPIRRPSSPESSEAWSVFQNPRSGQLVGRAPDIHHLRAMLSLLRVDLDALEATLDQPVVAGAAAGGGVNLQVKADLHAIDRTLVKIGLNLTAHLFAPGALRRVEFDAAVAYAIGEGAAPRRAQLPSELLGPAIANRHVFCLSVDTDPKGNPALLFMARLYDAGPVESFVLAQFVAAPPKLESTVVHVDYTANQFERMTLEKHLLRAHRLTGDADLGLLSEDEA
ncbi:MAG TPA: hypothetical protein VIT90_06620 [Lysobacter sp.]